MSPEAEDWRLRGQDGFLAGAVLVHEIYRAPGEGWNHDHCEFCSAKFVDPDASASTSDALTGGWTTTAEHEHGAGYHWICDSCFDDFRERFRWHTIQAG